MDLEFLTKDQSQQKRDDDQTITTLKVKLQQRINAENDVRGKYQELMEKHMAAEARAQKIQDQNMGDLEKASIKQEKTDKIVAELNRKLIKLESDSKSQIKEGEDQIKKLENNLNSMTKEINDQAKEITELKILNTGTKQDFNELLSQQKDDFIFQIEDLKAELNDISALKKDLEENFKLSNE